MFSVIHRRNWQENQQKTTAAIPAECLHCIEQEKEIKTLKANLLTAKSANNERIEELQKHVETLVLQNENLVKTIQKLICQSTIIPKQNVKVPDDEVNKQSNKCATGLKLENKEKKENVTKKFLVRGKTGVIGPQVKNKVIKGKSNKQFRYKCMKTGKFIPERIAKVEGQRKTVKVEIKGKTVKSTPQVAFEGKEVKIVVRKLECEGQFLYIGKKSQDGNKKVECMSSDEEVDVERLFSSSSSSEDGDDSDKEVLNNGVRSNKLDVSKHCEDATVAMKCLWHDPGKLICDKTFKGSSQLEVHLRRVHLPRTGMKMRCYWKNCVRKGHPFNRSQTFTNHLCIHTGVKRFVCKAGCGRAFIKKYNADHHTCGTIPRQFRDTERRPANPQPLNRGQLPANFPSGVPVTSTHQVVRATVKHHWCRFPRCGKKFATSKSLKQHQDNVHCPEKRFRCATCGKTFLHGGDLEVHELLHRQRSFPCPNCEKSFYDLHSLKSHKRSVHLEEKRYRCMHPNCSKMLSSSLALENHVKGHTGQQPYRCSYPTCATRFTDKGSIKKHLLRVHTGSKRRCVLEGCNELFASRLLCIQHQLLVHMDSFLNPQVSNGVPMVEMVESEHAANNQHETDYVHPVPEKDTSYDIDIKYEGSVQPEWDNFYGVKVKCEKPDVEEEPYDAQMNYEDSLVENENSYDMDVNYEKSMSENGECYDMEENNVEENNVNYSDVPNGIGDETDTNDSIVIVDVPEPVVAVPDIWFV